MSNEEKLQHAMKALMDIAEENSNLTPLGCRTIAVEALGKIGYVRAWVKSPVSESDDS